MKSFVTMLGGCVAALALSAVAALAPTPALAKNVASAECYLNVAGDNCNEVGELTGQPTVRTAHPTSLSASSGNVANAAAVATLAAATGKTNYLNGFTCTASGATSGLAVNVTVTGLLGGTKTYTFVFPAGALVGATPLSVNFPEPLPGSAANTAIVVTLPAGGTGNTNASCNAEGFRL